MGRAAQSGWGGTAQQSSGAGSATGSRTAPGGATFFPRQAAHRCATPRQRDSNCNDRGGRRQHEFDDGCSKQQPRDRRLLPKPPLLVARGRPPFPHSPDLLQQRWFEGCRSLLCVAQMPGKDNTLIIFKQTWWFILVFYPPPQLDCPYQSNCAPPALLTSRTNTGATVVARSTHEQWRLGGIRFYLLFLTRCPNYYANWSIHFWQN